jgi:hypothetical protein
MRESKCGQFISVGVVGEGSRFNKFPSPAQPLALQHKDQNFSTAKQANYAKMGRHIQPQKNARNTIEYQRFLLFFVIFCVPLRPIHLFVRGLTNCLHSPGLWPFFRGSKNSLAGDLGLRIARVWLMNATDSALKSFGKAWKFRKAQGASLAGKAYGHPAKFVPEKAICQSII